MAWGARGILFEGPSGAGKSSMALMLAGQGARLIADDRVTLRLHHGLPYATPPSAIAGMIEVRGTGILGLLPASGAAPGGTGAWIVAVARLATGEAPDPPRLPEAETCDILGHPVTLLRGRAGPTFAATCLHLLKTGRRTP